MLILPLVECLARRIEADATSMLPRKLPRHVDVAADIASGHVLVGGVTLLIHHPLVSEFTVMFVGRFCCGSPVRILQLQILILIARIFRNLRILCAQIFLMGTLAGAEITLGASDGLVAAMLIVRVTPCLRSGIAGLRKFALFYLNIR